MTISHACNLKTSTLEKYSMVAFFHSRKLIIMSIKIEEYYLINMHDKK